VEVFKMKSDQLQNVTFGQAKALNALGFDWPTIARYDDHGILYEYYEGCENWNDEEETDSLFSAPTVALALKWLRDAKGLRLGIVPCKKAYTGYCISDTSAAYAYPTYEEAESAILDRAIAELAKAEGDGR